MKIEKSTLRELKTYFENRIFIDRKSTDWTGNIKSTEDVRRDERFLELLKEVEKLTE